MRASVDGTLCGTCCECIRQYTRFENFLQLQPLRKTRRPVLTVVVFESGVIFFAQLTRIPPQVPWRCRRRAQTAREPAGENSPSKMSQIMSTRECIAGTNFAGAGNEVAPQPREANREDGDTKGSGGEHCDAPWGARRQCKGGRSLFAAGSQGEYADSGRSGRAKAQRSNQTLSLAASETIVPAPLVM